MNNREEQLAKYMLLRTETLIEKLQINLIDQPETFQCVMKHLKSIITNDIDPTEAFRTIERDCPNTNHWRPEYRSIRKLTMILGTNYAFTNYKGIKTLINTVSGLHEKIVRLFLEQYEILNIPSIDVYWEAGKEEEAK